MTNYSIIYYVFNLIMRFLLFPTYNLKQIV